MTLWQKIAFRIFTALKNGHDRVWTENIYRSRPIAKTFRFSPNVWFDGDVSIEGPGYINGPGYLVAGKNGKIVIGPNCEIASNCHMRAETHDTINSTGANRTMRAGLIHIEANVWIGTNVFIGPNVRIGKGAIIGANSVVVKDVPAQTIFAGVPAKMIRTLKQGT